MTLGAFLIPYVIMLTFLGIPCVMTDFSLGQYSGAGPLTLWQMSPIFRGKSRLIVTNRNRNCACTSCITADVRSGNAADFRSGSGYAVDLRHCLRILQHDHRLVSLLRVCVVQQ